MPSRSIGISCNTASSITNRAAAAAADQRTLRPNHDIHFTQMDVKLDLVVAVCSTALAFPSPETI